jgi:lysophospholipase L1-like esterase
MRAKWVYPAFIVVFTLVSAEVLLRAFKRNQTWSERVGHGYQSGYNQNHPTWFFSWKPNAEFDLDQKDFKYHYKTNHLGIRERDTFYTDTSAAKILCLGDSYTEGYGAPYDSSYPKLMEQALNQRGFHSQVYNAGIAASDPFFAYILLKLRLLIAQPEYVFITFNSSDLTDFIYRGGSERFKPDGTVQGRKSPWYEPAYQHSYLARFFINTVLRKTKQNLFLTKRQYKEEYCPRAVSEALAVYQYMSQMGEQEGYELMVVIQPIANELVYQNSENDSTKQLFASLEDSLNAHHIKNINMCRALEGEITVANKDELSYANDCHYTPSGYLLFTNSLLKAIDEKYPDYWK